MTEDKTPRRALTAITADEEIQQRAVHIDEQVVSDYAERIEAGDTFPPVVVFQGDDGQLILADGFHRYHAYKKAGKGQVRSPRRLHAAPIGGSKLWRMAGAPSRGSLETINFMNHG